MSVRKATPTTNGYPTISPGPHTALTADGGESSLQASDEAPTTHGGGAVAKAVAVPLFLGLFGWTIFRRLFGSR